MTVVVVTYPPDPFPWGFGKGEEKTSNRNGKY
jgi:hypothetical protein